MPSSWAFSKAWLISWSWRRDSWEPKYTVAPTATAAHPEGLLHPGEQRLIMHGRIGEEFVVVDLDDEGDLVGVFASHRAEDPEVWRRRRCSPPRWPA